jgi:hypothetical protein
MLRPPRQKMIRLILAGLAIALLALAGITLGPLLFASNEYDHLLSIEQEPPYRDPARMAQAWALPVAQLYRAKGIVYQSNPSFCGPASIATVLGSLGRSMSQNAVLDGTDYEPWFGVLIGGLTLDELGDLLRQRTGKKVEVLRNLTIADFRRHLAASNDPKRRYIINFHRGPLFGRGHGHHSPILGYLPDQDLVLIGDVNADYKPYLVRADRLQRAINTVDGETGDLRGMLLLHAD